MHARHLTTVPKAASTLQTKINVVNSRDTCSVTVILANGDSGATKGGANEICGGFLNVRHEVADYVRLVNHYVN